jgi:hypothetical protein
MILSGMGPLHNPKTDAGKLFAGIYALYSASPCSSSRASRSLPPSIALHWFHLA